MADAVVQLPADGAGKKLDAESLTVGLNTVYRERIQISGDSATDIAPVTAADGLLVDLGANNDVTVTGSVAVTNAGLTELAAAIDTELQVDVVAALPTGTNSIGQVTANAGTNLNTSALALEAGNLATAVASLSVIDDWDETDRAKVNIIAGQVGVAGGAGAVSALTQRVVVATDQTAIPVSGTVSITGSATEAKQDTQITHLATIAGDTTDIETAVELIDDTVATLGTDTYTEATTKGLIVGAIRRDADTTLVNTTNEVSPLQVDANGRLKVEAFSGETLPVSLTSTTVTGTVAVTQSGTWDEIGINDSGNSITIDNTDVTATAVSLAIMDDWDESDRAKVNPIAGQAGVQGASGAVTALTQRVVLATDVALPTGTNTLGSVTPLPLATGGLTTFRSIDLDETEEEVKATAGTLYGWFIANLATTTRFVKFYNLTAANTTVGSSTPVMTLPIPGNSSDDVAANALGGIGIKFDTAISVAATTGIADADTGAPGANEVVINLFYL